MVNKYYDGLWEISKIFIRCSFTLDEEEIVAMPIEISNDNDRRKSKSSMEVHVYIVDTFCELSEQIVQFSATPCGSFNKVNIRENFTFT